MVEGGGRAICLLGGHLYPGQEHPYKGTPPDSTCLLREKNRFNRVFLMLKYISTLDTNVNCLKILFSMASALFALFSILGSLCFLVLLTYFLNSCLNISSAISFLVALFLFLPLLSAVDLFFV